MVKKNKVKSKYTFFVLQNVLIIISGLGKYAALSNMGSSSSKPAKAIEYQVPTPRQDPASTFPSERRKSREKVKKILNFYLEKIGVVNSLLSKKFSKEKKTRELIL